MSPVYQRTVEEELRQVERLGHSQAAVVAKASQQEPSAAPAVVAKASQQEPDPSLADDVLNSPYLSVKDKLRLLFANCAKFVYRRILKIATEKILNSLLVSFSEFAVRAATRW